MGLGGGILLSARHKAKETYLLQRLTRGSGGRRRGKWGGRDGQEDEDRYDKKRAIPLLHWAKIPLPSGT